MSAHVVIVDLFGLVLVALGFSMAFRQSFVRRMLGWSPAPGKTCEADPTAYGLRIRRARPVRRIRQPMAFASPGSWSWFSDLHWG